MREGVRTLAIVATHPIQYQVPWFRALAAQPGIDLKVYFALAPDAEQAGDWIRLGIPVGHTDAGWLRLGGSAEREAPSGAGRLLGEQHPGHTHSAGACAT